MKGTDPRLERIAAIHRAHASKLDLRVKQRAHAAPPTIEAACSHAWLRLISHPGVDVSQPRRALAWLAQTATREAWHLERRRRRDELLDPRRSGSSSGTDRSGRRRARGVA